MNEDNKTEEVIEEKAATETMVTETAADEKIDNKKKKKHGVLLFLLGMLAGCLWMICIYFGTMGVKNLIYHASARNNGLVVNGNSIIDNQMYSKLKTLEALIDTYYYEDIEKNELSEGIYAGLMNSVGDPYTCYYTAEELKKQDEDMNGKFQGIGAYLTMDFTMGYPTITGVMENSPAEEAGLAAGDYIYKVDDEDVAGLTLDEVVRKVRGEEGTTVKLTIAREGEEIEFTCERRMMTSDTVKYELQDGDIGYIKVSEFDAVTPEQFENALQKAKNDNTKGIIVDLRSNPGGNLKAVVQMCEDILPKGLIVYTEDKNGNRIEYSSDGANELKLPLVVLVNEYSASASEIFAGAVKDYEIGTLVGKNTYGKGIVQSVIPLEDGSAIKITTSKYYTPKGNNIHKIGIKPDVEVEFDSEKYVNDKIDTQLEEGKRVLREKIEGK